jgi:hypothetical protein
MQYGWLDLFGEKWLLLTRNFGYPLRSWTDRSVALAELREEGWTVSVRPPRRRRTMSSGQRTYGYVMTRTIH